MADEAEGSLSEINAALAAQFAPIERAVRVLKRTPEYMAWQGLEEKAHKGSEALTALHKKNSEHYKKRPDYEAPEHQDWDKRSTEIGAQIKAAEEAQEGLREKEKVARAAIVGRAFQDFAGGGKLAATLVLAAAMGEPMLQREFDEMGVGGGQARG